MKFAFFDLSSSAEFLQVLDNLLSKLSSSRAFYAKKRSIELGKSPIWELQNRPSPSAGWNILAFTICLAKC